MFSGPTEADVARRMDFSVAERVVVGERVVSTGGALARLNDAVDANDGNGVLDAWGDVCEHVAYMAQILKMTADSAVRQIKKEE